MKPKTALFLTLIILPLLFSGCFSTWEEDAGTIILNFDNINWGMSDDELDVPLNELKYEITFTGANEEFTNIYTGKQPFKTTVSPGKWKITVKAYEYVESAGATTFVRKEYAFGRQIVRVKPNESATVKMKMTDKGVVEIYFIGFVEEQYSVEDYKFLITFYDEKDRYEREYIGKGPHLVQLKRGSWKIFCEKIIGINYPSAEEIPEKFIIDDDDFSNSLFSNPYTERINPGDHKVLYVKIGMY